MPHRPPLSQLRARPTYIGLIPPSIPGQVGFETETVVQLDHPSTPSRGSRRRDFFWQGPAVLLFAGAASCKKKKTDAPSGSDPYVELSKRVATLDDYMLRQSFADMRKVHGVFIKEAVLRNPRSLGAAYSPEMLHAVSNVQHHAQTIMLIRTRQTKVGGKILLQGFASPTVVVIESKLVPLISGTPAEQNSFDSILYHEIEGHGEDHRNGSHYDRLNIKLLRLMKTNQTLAMFEPIMEDIREFTAYLMEMDRLIRKLNYDKDPSVIVPSIREGIESDFVNHAIRLMKVLSKDPGSNKFVRRVHKLFKDYCARRVRSISGRTRSYAWALLRRKGWKRPIPF